MNMLLAALALATAEARIVTIQEVTTAAPTTITNSLPPAVVTNDETVWLSTTIFEASTIVTTVPTGTINTEPLTSVSNPVVELSFVSTSALSKTIDPSTYEGSFTVVATTSQSSQSGAQSPNSASSSSSQGETVSTPSSASSAASTASAGSTSSTSSSTIASSPGAFSESALSTASTASATTSTFATSSASPSSSSDSLSSQSFQSSSSSSSTSVTTSSAPSSTASTSTSAASTSPTSAAFSGPIFNAITSDAPPTQFPRENLAIQMPSNYDSNQICQTNKFYDNFLLGGLNLTSFAQPYGVFYSNDVNYFGVGVSYTNKSQRVYGPDASANPVEYYSNPLMLKSLVLSAKEFTIDDLLEPAVDAMGPFSANITLKTANCWPNQKLVVPLAIGSGFVTGIYDGYTPRLFSQLGIRQIVKVKSSDCAENLQKFVVSLMNGMQWNVYVDAPQGFEFTPVSDYEVMGNFAASGSDSIVVQIAVVTSNEQVIDSAAGAFPTGAILDGEANGDVVTYRIEYDVAGTSKSGSTLLYALPHHVTSFSAQTQTHTVSSLTVYSPTKGYLTGVLANTLEMEENISSSPTWLNGNGAVLSSDTLKLLASTVNSELSEDITSQLDPTSTYSSGKVFDKFAYLLLVASDVLGNQDVAKEGLDRLKQAIEPWTQNTQQINLMYDTLLKGIVSTGANRPGGSPMADYGNPYYNDHHFHYGYFVHAAAVIAKLDAEIGDNTWLNTNKDWVNSLVRDVANPSSEDTFFPVSRMFDYFHGHSWAHGMFESGDGKDEESTSEDYNFAYGMKLWGEVTGDEAMATRGALMLAVLKRSLNSYFLYTDDNTIEPSNYIGNRVAGISFENKLDHTTYFGTNLEYIQGIQMIPLTPASLLIRQPEFVQQEWDSLLAPIVGSLHSGWAGILRANQAIIDANASYQYFASPSFGNQLLDNGASRSWYLAFAALQGGSA